MKPANEKMSSKHLSAKTIYCCTNGDRVAFYNSNDAEKSAKLSYGKLNPEIIIRTESSSNLIFRMEFDDKETGTRKSEDVIFRKYQLMNEATHL